MDWIVASIVLSVVLTVVLNVALRAFPGAGRSVARRLDATGSSGRDRSGGVGDGGGQDARRVRVWFPWKGMLVASLLLTVLLNLALWLS